MAPIQITNAHKPMKFYELISTVIFISSNSTHAIEPINKSHSNFTASDWKKITTSKYMQIQDDLMICNFKRFSSALYFLFYFVFYWVFISIGSYEPNKTQMFVNKFQSFFI